MADDEKEVQRAAAEDSGNALIFPIDGQQASRCRPHAPNHKPERIHD